jgi:hypothetical protein
VGALCLRHAVAPAWSEYKLPTELTRTAALIGAPAAIHGISYRQTGGLVYYSDAALPILRDPRDLSAWLAAPEPRLAYVDRDDYRGGAVVIAESPYRGGTLLVSNGVNGSKGAEEEP